MSNKTEETRGKKEAEKTADISACVLAVPVFTILCFDGILVFTDAFLWLLLCGSMV